MSNTRIPPFGVRMPKDLHEWVKEKAAEQGRSMNNFIVFALQSKRQAEEAAAQK